MIISERVVQKLAEKHGVNKSEIVECFTNRESNFLTDMREDHQTNPPTMWFVAQTDFGRKLKVAFIQDANTGEVIIKTAYEANAEEQRIYDKFAN